MASRPRPIQPLTRAAVILRNAIQNNLDAGIQTHGRRISRRLFDEENNMVTSTPNHRMKVCDCELTQAAKSTSLLKFIPTIVILLCHIRLLRSSPFGLCLYCLLTNGTDHQLNRLLPRLVFSSIHLLHTDLTCSIVITAKLFQNTKQAARRGGHIG